MDLIWMLRTIIAALPQIFIGIDALDECLLKFLPELLESGRDIGRESPSTRVFLTGRPMSQRRYSEIFRQDSRDPINPDTDDILNYVEMKLDEDAEPKAMTDDFRADIVGVILERISDMCVGPFRISTLSVIILTKDFA